jgi:hypothetical protein
MHVCVNTGRTMKSFIFWDITSSLLNANQCSGGTFFLHLFCQRISQGRNQREAGSKSEPLVGLFFDIEDGGNMFL